MQRRQVRHESKYSRHTISVRDEDWELIKQDSLARGISISRLLVDAAKQNIELPQYNTLPIRLKLFNRWYEEGEHERPLGKEMWICQNFPDSFYYLDSPFHEERQIRRHMVDELERHVEESTKYHRRLLKHIEGTQFSSHEIYSEFGFRELADGSSRYGEIPYLKRIDGLEKILEHLESSHRKFEVMLFKKPIRLNFRIHLVNDHHWANIWGESVYLYTDDPEVVDGLLVEFWGIRGQCERKDKEYVINFVRDLIDEIRSNHDS